MKTSQRSIFDIIEETSTYSQGASPANPLAPQESEKELTMKDISGRKCLEQFERLRQPTSWAKMYADSLIGMGEWFSTRCALNWKLVGTKSNRFYFQLQVSTLPIEEIESGLLLTPTTMERAEDPKEMRKRAKEKGYRNGTKYNSLMSQVVYGDFLPTPSSMIDRSHPETWDKRAERKAKEGINLQMGLTTMARKGMLPTPLASEAYKAGKTSKQDSLTTRVKRGEMLPTPLKNDCNAARPSENWEGSDLGGYINKGNTGKLFQLNPRFVGEMMGFPPTWTELPFLNGETNPSKPTETQ